MNEFASYIVLTTDYIAFKESILIKYGAKNLRFFENESFLIEDAKNVISEAYIAENNTKFIIIKANKFGIEAQNSLLKIIEEPPRNIVFIVVTNSRNSLLPTIRSRLMIKNMLTKKIFSKTGLNFNKLTLKNISLFIDEKVHLERIGELTKMELKELISQIIKECFEQGIKFSEKELIYINKLIVLADLNTKTAPTLTPLLLMIGAKS